MTATSHGEKGSSDGRMMCGDKKHRHLPSRSSCDWKAWSVDGLTKLTGGALTESALQKASATKAMVTVAGALTAGCRPCLSVLVVQQRHLASSAFRNAPPAALEFHLPAHQSKHRTESSMILPQVVVGRFLRQLMRFQILHRINSHLLCPCNALLICRFSTPFGPVHRAHASSDLLLRAYH